MTSCLKTEFAFDGVEIVGVFEIGFKSLFPEFKRLDGREVFGRKRTRFIAVLGEFLPVVGYMPVCEGCPGGGRYRSKLVGQLLIGSLLVAGMYE